MRGVDLPSIPGHVIPRAAIFLQSNARTTMRGAVRLPGEHVAGN
jgi:hypothetical protein